MSMLRSFVETRAEPVVEVPAEPTAPQGDPAAAAARRALLLRDPALSAAIRRTLRRRVPPQDLEDLVNVTLAHAWRSPHLPSNRAMCRPYVCGVARRVAAYHARAGRRLVEAKARPMTDRTRGLSAGANAIEAKLALESLMKRADPDTRTAIGWFFRHALGESYATIAGEALLPYEKVLASAEAARDLLAEQVVPFCIVAIVLLLVWAAARSMVIPSQDVAKPPRPTPTVEPAPRSPRQAQESAPKRDAAQIRARALAACEQKQWGDCVGGLDEAGALDPSGDDSPAVRSARTRALNALDPKLQRPHREAPGAPGEK